MTNNIAFHMGPVVKARAMIELLRPELPLAAGICVVAGQVIALGDIPSAFTGFLGFLAGFFISAAAMVTNDYFDLEVDRVNHPGRPLPSGRISSADVLALTCLLSAVGFAAAALLGPIALALAAAMWAASILYNWRFKESGLPGNILVAFCVASTFILGGITAGGVAGGLVLAFGALAFIFDLGEEIAAAAMDMEGDAKRSARTLARVHGREFALGVAAFLFVALAVLSYVPLVVGWLSPAYLFIFVPMSLAILYLAITLRMSKTVMEGRGIVRRLYLVMTLFVVAFIAFRVL